MTTLAPNVLEMATGGVTTPAGFRAAGVEAGIKGRGGLDLALIVSDRAAHAAAVFTTNRAQAAPVLVSREHLAQSGGLARAIVVNSGCANACTGDEGLRVARGMAEETALLLNEAIRRGAERQQGLGQAVAAFLAQHNAPHADHSIAVAAHRHDIPLTVHVALGTDIIHMHPAASGAAIGEASLRDFRYFTSSVGRLEGGVYLNCGSAVILPEVFLKAVALVLNKGIPLDDLTTVNVDFLRMYRPQTNVVARPVAGTSGTGISLIGHHEVLIPLLAAALVEED